MPNWNGLVLTKKGQLLQAKVGTGVVLALTKMKLGSGVLPKGTSIEDLTDLVAPEQNVGIASKEVLTDQKMCKISATITNVGLSAGYYVRELGVFADDPDDGEILYAVTFDSAPDYLPAEGGSTAVSQEFDVYISASTASNVKVSIDPGALATMGYVETAIADHNSLATAHENRFKLFEKIADFGDDLIKKLALTTAISAITALETNSWFGQLLKMALTASGVKYNIAQNGYVRFGAFFGGLIIQWGSYDSISYYTDITFPITFHDEVYVVHFADAVVSESLENYYVYSAAWNTGATTASNTRLLCSNSTGIGKFSMIVIGK